MLDPQTLINGYLDETLSSEELVCFQQWLRETPQNRQRFAEAALLHDRLRGEILAMSTTTPPVRATAAGDVRSRSPWRRGSYTTFVGAFLTIAFAMVLIWKGVVDTPASAAAGELNRLIVANSGGSDRTYQISVEEVAVPRNRNDRRPPEDFGRPPKPPLDSAILHVRGGNQFVLLRQTPEGLPFITGSNGRTSWAARPDGPVRVSSDLTRFNRDLPGHESSIPLINIKAGLAQLRATHDVQLLPIEAEDESDLRSADEPLRLLVAVKKRGVRGPRRVEITYSVATGRIRQMRFVDMPYGPERLTLRLTLVDERELGTTFFDHESHHSPERTVEKE